MSEKKIKIMKDNIRCLDGLKTEKAIHKKLEESR